MSFVCNTMFRNLINRKSQLEAKVVELKAENKRLINRLDMIK